MKKGISPVVATALLLVVAVVSVVGFQGWFTEFSSSTFVDVETQTSGQSSVNIEGIVGNKIYLKSTNNVSINSISVNNIDCNINSTVKGLNNFNISPCMENVSGSANIIVVTDNGIFESYKYISGSSNNVVLSSPSSDCSGLLGGDWLEVSGNPTLGTDDFCIMKYGAKQNGSDANSVPAGSPWVNINQTDARIACSNLGTGYKLITDPEWVTVARITELDSTNWDSGIVYSGSMWRGHSDNSPGNALSVSDVNDYYDQTGNSNPSIERRTLNISGNLIWDLGGNVWEWTNDTFNSNAESALGQGSSNWYQWNIIGSSWDFLKPFNNSLTSTNGIGQVYNEVSDAFPSGTIHGFLRGGAWYDGARAGAFALHSYFSPSSAFSAGIGFRCSYAP